MRGQTAKKGQLVVPILILAFVSGRDKDGSIERSSIRDVLKRACGLRVAYEGQASKERSITMKIIATLLVLVGHCFGSQTVAVGQPQNCKKLCRDDYAACVKAHTQGACKTNYGICTNHCPK
jgi:hypothetical protein